MISALETSLHDEALSLRDRVSVAKKFIIPAGLMPCLPIKLISVTLREALIQSGFLQVHGLHRFPVTKPVLIRGHF